jgi:hypothetical protein
MMKNGEMRNEREKNPIYDSEHEPLTGQKGANEW